MIKASDRKVGQTVSRHLQNSGKTTTPLRSWLISQVLNRRRFMSRDREGAVLLGWARWP